MKLVAGTRGSALALAQTEIIISMLKDKNPDLEIEIKIIKTKGDRILDKALDKIGDKGLFVNEIESQIKSGEIDFAVHSLKDMPSQITEGLKLTSVPLRANPRDVLVVNPKHGLAGRDDIAEWLNKSEGLKIGTGSKRRIVQLLKINESIIPAFIRGNIDTRLKKLVEEDMDAIVIAAAGLERLEIEGYSIYEFPYDEMIPACGQGSLAIEIKEENRLLDEMFDEISDRKSDTEVRAERAFLARINGGCHIPVGAISEIDGDFLKLTGIYGDEEMKNVASSTIKGKKKEAEILGAALADDLVQKVSLMKNSIGPKKVYLVGAGPGSADLITVKGLECIKKADVIIYDRLINRDLLQYRRECAELIYVGKEAHNHEVPQNRINDIIIEKYNENKTVVRLKGGDPYVFGRGGEEGQKLSAEGIDFEVVPGISSAIGGLCYAGIPVTHRDFASSFHVLTGNLKKDREPDYNWKALAGEKSILVFLMGVGNIAHITGSLIKNGMDENTPCAFVCNATYPDQKTYRMRLGDAKRSVDELGIKPPAVFVVGEVVKLSGELGFFERKPLAGKTVIVTRTKNVAGRLKSELEELGAKVEVLPTISISNIADAQKTLADRLKKEKYGYVAFTSQNSVEFFFQALMDNYMDARDLGNMKVAAIGSATRDALLKYGIVVDIMPKEGYGESLADEIAKYNRKDNAKVLFPCSGIAMDRFEKRLKSKNIDVDRIEIYKNEVNMKIRDSLMEGLKNRKADYITFTSTSTFKYLIEIIGDENRHLIDGIKKVSIGNTTSGFIREYGVQVDIQSEKPTLASMVEAILEDATE